MNTEKHVSFMTHFSVFTVIFTNPPEFLGKVMQLAYCSAYCSDKVLLLGNVWNFWGTEDCLLKDSQGEKLPWGEKFPGDILNRGGKGISWDDLKTVSNQTKE